MREEDKSPIGTIDIDAIYSPVQKVNYSVEPVRVGKMTNYDKLTLEIQTDGTVTPDETLKKSAEILINQFDIIKNFKIKIKKEKGTTAKEKIKATNIKSMKIEESDFSNRTKNALINNKIKTVAGLARLSDESLLEIKGLGNKGIQEIKDKLKAWKV